MVKLQLLHQTAQRRAIVIDRHQPMPGGGFAGSGRRGDGMPPPAGRTAGRAGTGEQGAAAAGADPSGRLPAAFGIASISCVLLAYLAFCPVKRTVTDERHLVANNRRRRLSSCAAARLGLNAQVWDCITPQLASHLPSTGGSAGLWPQRRVWGDVAGGDGAAGAGAGPSTGGVAGLELGGLVASRSRLCVRNACRRW